MRTYKEIKEELLKIDGVNYVRISSYKKRIIIEVKDGYVWKHPNEIISEYLINKDKCNIHDKVIIGDRTFVIWGQSYSKKFNTQMELELKEI